MEVIITIRFNDKSIKPEITILKVLCSKNSTFVCPYCTSNDMNHNEMLCTLNIIKKCYYCNTNKPAHNCKFCYDRLKDGIIY